jgi:hypothetical protein
MHLYHFSVALPNRFIKCAQFFVVVIWINTPKAVFDVSVLAFQLDFLVFAGYYVCSFYGCWKLGTALSRSSIKIQGMIINSLVPRLRYY